MIVGIEGLFFSTATTQWQAKKKKENKKPPKAKCSGISAWILVSLERDVSKILVWVSYRREILAVELWHLLVNIISCTMSQKTE